MDHYTGIAPLYEPLLGGILGPLRRAVTTAAAQAARDAGVAPERLRMLDCCCGTGGQLRLLAKSFSAFGLDRSPPMLARALDLAGPRLVRADAAQIPFAADTFDAASVSLALHEMGRPLALAALGELSRVVRPGGSLLLVDWASPLPWYTVPGGHMAERTAGREHYRNFRAYQAAGGLPDLCRAAGLAMRETGRFCLGALVLARCRLEG
ncbi:Methyltransferase type 11 [Desulfovibrio sp. X2]|uniref:class I SAM-dependent methyltransferase n=1 Tax=Desulfovibrio sp. X2 TaxID=941449 RepID=UPI000358A94A|nr:methyltransferase domain-containing protein [Desulfovibrio sp. X2]EPR43863.1 Methyltransferase type 11 [Desulfovibrio sp. X2]